MSIRSGSGVLERSAPIYLPFTGPWTRRDVMYSTHVSTQSTARASEYRNADLGHTKSLGLW